MGTQKASLIGSAWGGVIALAMFSALASAQQAPASKGTKSNDQKVDITDLENKYWAPKDTDFTVVQNRTYTKEHRFFLTPQYGRAINNQWDTGNLYGLTGNYFWSERMGIQISALTANLTNNDAANTLAGYGSGVQPDHGRMTGYYGVGYNVVPFYAKMSFWGKKIIYFDMAVTPTLGVTNYDQIVQTGNRPHSAFTYGVDLTQFFFFTNYFAIRLDLKNQWHPEGVAADYGNANQGTTTGQLLKNQTTQDTLFLFGLTFFY